MHINDKTQKYIHLVFDIVMSLMLVACGISFAVSCYLLYTSGKKQPFTYQSVSNAFDKIDVLAYITLALIVVGAVLSVALPREEGKLRGIKSVKATCLNFQKRVDLDTVPAEERKRILGTRKLRLGLLIAFVVLAVLEAVLPFIYLLNRDNFPSDDKNMEVALGLVFYICMLLPILVYGIVYYYLTRASYRREAEMLKSAIKSGATPPPADREETGKWYRIRRFFLDRKNRILLGTRLTVLWLAAFFIVLGILNDGVSDVLIKAINICAECIGLG